MKFLKRLKEPSTWAGIAGLVSVFSPTLAITIKTAGIAIASILAIALPETTIVN